MKRGLSLKVKLLFLLILVPVLALAVYSIVAIDLFKKDKIAYIYDSSSAIASGLASQVKAEIDSVSSFVRPLVAEYNAQDKAFTAVAEKVFYQDDHLKYLSVFHFDGAGSYTIGGRIKKGNFQPQGNWIEMDAGLRLVKQAANHGLLLHLLDSRTAMFAFRNGQKSQANHSVVMTVVQLNNLVDNFRAGSNYMSYLVGPDGGTILGQTTGEIPSNFSQWQFFSQLKASQTTNSAFEEKGPDGVDYLISYSDVGSGGLAVISLVRRELAFSAAKVLITKSFIFLIVILSFSFLVSVFASSRLTAALRKLASATRKIAEGEYNVEIDINSKDEVQGLADSFKTMAGEIDRLMRDNVEKARMEKELETAKVVQDSLFPDEKAQLSDIKVSGYYESASECGGDWWHYCEIENYVYLWIGDATGHGAPAALITSAAKSVASIVETMPIMKPSEIMSLLNRSICENSQGRVCMTFFIARIEKESGVLEYSNASHEPPILIPYKSDGGLRRSDLEPIISELGCRLGESIDSQYKDDSIQINEKDILLFYTDGVTELMGPEGMFEERRLIRSIIGGMKREFSIDSLMECLDQDLETFRAEEPLHDDVTYFSISYR